MTSPRDNDQADNDGGYDPAGDPRTGRPPLAVDAEQVRQNAEMEASINEMSVGADHETIDEGGTSESDESDNPSDIENEADADEDLEEIEIPEDGEIQTYSGKAPVSAEPFERAEPGHSDRVFAGASLPKQARRSSRLRG